MKSKNYAWVRMGRNIILESEDESFYISYNAGNFDIDTFAPDGNSDETAIQKDGQYYILNGDFRNKYAELLDKGFDACIAFFMDNQNLKSSWSNDWEGIFLNDK